MDNLHVYILELSGGKYYVGKSRNPKFRYQQHIDGKGCGWTKKYPPISIIKIYDNCSHFDEDKYTKEYMFKYGIENVRGGAYATMELESEQINFLRKEIWGSSDLCNNCGKYGHFSADCDKPKESEKREIDDFTCNKCKKTLPNQFQYVKHMENHKLITDIIGTTGLLPQHMKPQSKKSSPINIKCFKCGKKGHYANKCTNNYM